MKFSSATLSCTSEFSPGKIAAPNSATACSQFWSDCNFMNVGNGCSPSSLPLYLASRLLKTCPSPSIAQLSAHSSRFSANGNAFLAVEKAETLSTSAIISRTCLQVSATFFVTSSIELLCLSLAAASFVGRLKAFLSFLVGGSSVFASSTTTALSLCCCKAPCKASAAPEPTPGTSGADPVSMSVTMPRLCAWPAILSSSENLMSPTPFCCKSHNAFICSFPGFFLRSWIPARTSSPSLLRSPRSTNLPRTSASMRSWGSVWSTMNCKGKLTLRLNS